MKMRTNRGCCWFRVRSSLLLTACLGLVSVASVTAQIVVTNVPVADALVRSLDPTHNYGGAGALSVSGPIATNATGQQEGLLDSFMRFDVASAVSNFNSSFGPGQWAISSVTLNLTEVGAPNNPDFNRGVGPFEARWIGSDSWLEGTGMPNSLATDGIPWNDESTNLNPNVDQSLGTFSNGGTNGLVTLSLGMPAAFVGDISAGGLVSLFLTATTNSTTGFTFNSHNFTIPSAWPFLEITAVSIPEITSLVFVGSNLTIHFTTVNHQSYTIEYNHDLVNGSWSPLTNITGGGGIMTAIDSGAASLPKRFYRIAVP